MITEPLGVQQVAFTDIYRVMLLNRIFKHICSTTASTESADVLLEMMEAEVLRERERGNVAIAKEEGKVLGMGLVALAPQSKPEPESYEVVVLLRRGLAPWIYPSTTTYSVVPFATASDAESWVRLNGLDGCDWVHVIEVESPDEVSW